MKLNLQAIFNGCGIQTTDPQRAYVETALSEFLKQRDISFRADLIGRVHDAVNDGFAFKGIRFEE